MSEKPHLFSLFPYRENLLLQGCWDVSRPKTRLRYIPAIWLLLCLWGCSGPLFYKPKIVYSPAPQPEQGINTSPSPAVDKLLNQYRQWRGVRYREGGQSKKGVDCSAFVQITYRKTYGIDVGRTVDQQIRTGRSVNRSDLRPGDLVFFKTGWFTRHVGIYIGSRRFLHASVSKGVTISDLMDEYWGPRYWQARRVH